MMHLQNHHVLLTSEKSVHEQLTTYGPCHETPITEQATQKCHCQTASLDTLLHRLRDIVPQTSSQTPHEDSIEDSYDDSESDIPDWTTTIIKDTVMYIKFLQSTLISQATSDLNDLTAPSSWPSSTNPP